MLSITDTPEMPEASVIRRNNVREEEVRQATEIYLRAREIYYRARRNRPVRAASIF